MVVKCVSLHSQELIAVWELWLAATAVTREYHTTCHQPKKISELEVWCLLNACAFHLIELKRCKLNHGKLGTTCVKQSGLSYFQNTSKYCHRTFIALKYFQSIHQFVLEGLGQNSWSFLRCTMFLSKGLLEQGSFSQIGEMPCGVCNSLCYAQFTHKKCCIWVLQGFSVFPNTL